MILNLHGFNSSGDSEKAEIIRQHFDNVVSPTLPPNPQEAVELIKNIIINSTEPVIIVGTSLGGFYGLYMCTRMDIPVILINPSLQPSKTLDKKVGMNLNYKTNETYEFKQEYVEMLSNMTKEIEEGERHSVLLNFFLAKQDELLDHSIISTLFPFAKTVKFYDDNHRFEKFEQIIPEIKQLVNYYKTIKGEQFDNYLNI